MNESFSLSIESILFFGFSLFTIIGTTVVIPMLRRSFEKKKQETGQGMPEFIIPLLIMQTAGMIALLYYFLFVVSITSL